MANNYETESLNAYNYTNWVSDVKYFLIGKDCWDIVTGSESKSVVNVTKGIIEKDTKEYRKR